MLIRARPRVLIFFIATLLGQFLWGANTNDIPYQQMLEAVFRTDLVYPQEKGTAQLAILPSFFNQVGEKNTMFLFDLEYGITDRWQIGFLADAYYIHHINDGPQTAGFGDIDIETQYSFMNINHTNYHLALLFDLGLPTGSIKKGLTEGFIEYEPTIAFARDFPSFHRSQLFGQIGFSFVQRQKLPPRTLQLAFNTQTNENEVQTVFPDIEPAANSFIFNMGYFLPIGSVRYTIEANWEINTWNHQGQDNDFYLTPGIVWELPKDWEIGLGTSIGLTPSSDHYDVFLRITWGVDFNKKKKSTKK